MERRLLCPNALKLDPDYEEAIYHLGLCYLDRNWNRKAIECFQEALELNRLEALDSCDGPYEEVSISA